MIPNKLNPFGINSGVDYNIMPLTFVAEEPNSSVKLLANGTVDLLSGMQYRYGYKGEWQQYVTNTVLPITSKGSVVQFQNTNNELSTASNNYAQFVMSGKISVCGNVDSMLGWNNTCKNYCFFSLFKDNSALYKSDNLVIPYDKVGFNSFNRMFINCSNMISTLKILIATQLDQYCYAYMYYNTKLERSPLLPALSMKLSCYAFMFKNCPLLMHASPLVAETFATNCYYQMYYNCPNLNEIHVNFKTWDTNATYQWLAGTAQTGTFYKPAELAETYGQDNIPSGWNVVNE